MKLRTVFMGTPEFAVPSLKMLHENTDVAAVFTQPDKPKGRGHKLASPPVKSYALGENIPVYQPDKLRNEEVISSIKKMEPDFIVVVAYGKILPKEILSAPRYGCINVHGSLLPKYRGAAPMEQAIISGEKITGITTMFMDEGLDTGDMLLKKSVPITEDMTLAELSGKLMFLGAEALKETFEGIVMGTIVREKQDDGEATYAHMIDKDTGHIDWGKDPQEIHNLVRGLNSWPGAYAYLNEERYKIWRTRPLEENLTHLQAAGEPGEILLAKDRLIVATGASPIEILELTAPGKKKLSSKDYLRGHKLPLPAKFL